MARFHGELQRFDGLVLPVLYWRKRMKNMYLRVKPIPQSGDVRAALAPALQKMADTGEPAPRFFVQVTLPRSLSQKQAAAFVTSREGWIKEQLAAAPARLVPPMTAAEQEAARAKLVPIVEGFLAKWCPVIGVEPAGVRYQWMTSRWGSCSQRTHKLSFNLQLADHPDAIIEYVVVHELCHFKEANHGPGFWREVERFLPDWRARRRALR